jgi:hypothetical protein
MNWRKQKKLWKQKYAPLIPPKGRIRKRRNGSDKAIRTVFRITGRYIAAGYRL